MSSTVADNPGRVTHVEFERCGKVAIIRLTSQNGPALLASRVLGELGKIVEQIDQDACIRFVVFRGEGPVFCAGNDIREMAHMDEDQAHALSNHGNNVMNAIENLPQITFAAMNGHALGGGCELALACSFRIMVAGAMIGQPEVQHGIIPGWGATKRLPMLAPLGWALRMLYSGEPISAEQAAQIGLIDELVGSESDLDAALARWFEMFNKCAPQAIIRMKRAILNRDESHQFGLCFRSTDPREGMTAFLEKRKPSWAIDAKCKEST